MKITLNEVGVFKARFMGFKPCQNPAYLMVKLQFIDFEKSGQITTEFEPQTSMILHEAVDMHIFHGVGEGQFCHLRMSVGYQAPNNKDGKSYPGGVKFRILQASVAKEQ